MHTPFIPFILFVKFLSEICLCLTSLPQSIYHTIAFFAPSRNTTWRLFDLPTYQGITLPTATQVGMSSSIISFAGKGTYNQMKT